MFKYETNPFLIVGASFDKRAVPPATHGPYFLDFLFAFQNANNVQNENMSLMSLPKSFLALSDGKPNVDWMNFKIEMSSICV